MKRRRLIAANRRNARLSTGPRSADGKQRAARNAVRHGLELPVLADPALAGDIAALAERLADGSPDSRMREAALGVAIAQVDVQRVLHARDLLVARQIMGRVMDERQIRQLCALDRYERQAMWRRRSATRAWQAARFDSIRRVP